MGRLVAFVLFGALVAGLGLAAYNQLHYDQPQPFPVSWNHLPEELQLLDLERERRTLVGRLGSAQRMASVGGRLMPIETTAGQIESIKSELAALDTRIAALKAEILAIRTR